MEISRRTVLKYGAAGGAVALISLGTVPVAAHATGSSGQPLNVNINPNVAAPLPSNFGGFNPDFQVVGMNFLDPQAADLARDLRAGTLRYPSGTDSDYFDVRTGNVRPEWAAQFFGKMTAFDTSLDDTQIIGAKPDLHRLSGFKKLLDDISGDTVIIINGFTDSPESAGAVAAYCVANNIRVAAYELSNEGWLLPTFFMDSTDYAARMKPYFEAIKAADPHAQVNVMLSQGEAPAWDQALADYPDKYWDGISFHMYGGGDRYSTFDDAVKDLNTRLADRTNTYIDSYYLAKGRPDMRVTVSEFNSTPSTMTKLSTSGVIRTLYNGIFAAEFITRLSSHPNVDRVMLHGLVQFGTTFTKPYVDTMKNAYERGASLDTSGFDFGVIKHGSALALSVCLDAINRSSHTLATGSDGTVTVPKYGGTVPAVYTQAYVGLDGYDYLVVTNKSNIAHSVTINWDGALLPGPFETRFINADDPRAENTAGAPNTVEVREGTSPNPVLVPGYSVMRIKWTRAGAGLAPSVLLSNGAQISGVQATGRRIQVSWKKGPGDDTHVVLCKTTDGTIVRKQVSKKSELTFAGLVLGTTYQLTVAPQSHVGAGVESKPVVVQLAVPASTTLDSVTPGDGAVVLAWKPVIGADSYRVRYGRTGTEASLQVGNSIGVEIAGLTNNSEYVFTVQAVNTYGESAPSAPLAATPDANIPYPPHTVLAAAGGSGTLVWWKPSYKRVLSSTFETGTVGWELQGPWSVVNLPGADGPLTDGRGMSNRLAIDGTGIATAGSDVRASHFVGAEVSFSSTLAGSAGLVLRYVDSANYYFAGFDFATAKHSIGRVVAGEKSVLAETQPITDAYAMPAANRQYTYRFELNASVLVLYRDGTEVLRVTDANLLSGAPGRVGIVSTGATVNYDRFHVEADTATGFDILRAAEAGGPYSIVASDSPGSTFLDTATSSASNYYRVLAVNGSLRSAYASHPAPSRLKNLARDASITASSTLAGTATAKLVDGIKNLDSSRWVSQPGEPHSLEFTWSSAKTIARVCVYSGFMANRGFQIGAYDLQRWADGAWETVASVTNNTKDAYDGGYNDLSFAPISTTKIRLYITDACVAPGYTNARVLEVEIYGK
ncbi:fibronectin type III domain-containing protein [Arthrobacter sp. B2a2-09]|uniref:fibronectin type III domain-containing protein n=1 Tax=Arthrobacter sp. B2a2-09 TaxID=2952822 RepID=UPI0022CD9D21|nr:fibronectin type III domain-containing protein [Arthrobacter sp. B2a2-09]MCZ9883294.1 fibronectin type III domain-containing protein [Arthrobacter sp. B2a2-09]